MVSGPALESARAKRFVKEVKVALTAAEFRRLVEVARNAGVSKGVVIRAALGKFDPAA